MFEADRAHPLSAGLSSEGIDLGVCNEIIIGACAAEDELKEGA